MINHGTLALTLAAVVDPVMVGILLYASVFCARARNLVIFALVAAVFPAGILMFFSGLSGLDDDAVAAIGFILVLRIFVAGILMALLVRLLRLILRRHREGNSAI